MKIIFLIITLITFVIFFIEALIHFNIGKNGYDYECDDNQNKSEKPNYININYYGILFHIPNYGEFIKISLTVLFFSIISGIISTLIIKYHIIN